VVSTFDNRTDEFERVGIMSIDLLRRDLLRFGSFALVGAGTMGGAVSGRETSAGATARAGLDEAYENGAYRLPPLPYDFTALEPAYDEKTLRIHYTKHHQGYVNGLNDALTKLEAARKSNDYANIQTLCERVAFHGSGHVLHTLFWNSMMPEKVEMPESLSQAMQESFGSTQNAQSQFAAATKAVEGSGWGVLVYEPIADKLLILQAGKHQNLTMWNVVPLFVCDVWEHAYYLQYQNNRASWVDNFMKIANWPFAAARLEHARVASHASV
jgi:Fe-Mn family superoxide dismutase